MSRGFTLVELVVTLLVIGLAAVVAVPAFLADGQRSDLDEGVARVESLLTMARDSAVRSGLSVRVVVDSASGYFWLDADPDPSGAGEDFGAGWELGAVLPGPIGLPTGVDARVSSARAAFLFRRDGSAWGDSILLTDGVRSGLVTLDPYSGHVVVLR